MRTEGNTIVEDVQNGQDIVVRIKNGEEWVDIFYVEVKSKWDFSEPAHMSTRQVRMAALHPNEYALCCVDLRKHKHEDLENLPTEIILECTNVKWESEKFLIPCLKPSLKLITAQTMNKLRFLNIEVIWVHQFLRKVIPWTFY